ncbi:hypothetical protein KM043_003675 [Ampulex compressa]|nr:hypothetical protein KM043_003675 [Ampulex compressa]
MSASLRILALIGLAVQNVAWPQDPAPRLHVKHRVSTESTLSTAPVDLDVVSCRRSCEAQHERGSLCPKPDGVTGINAPLGYSGSWLSDSKTKSAGSKKYGWTDGWSDLSFLEGRSFLV